MVSNINTSALNTYSEKLNVHATNIANTANEDYKSVDAKVENRSNGDQLALKLRTNDYETDLNVEIPEVMETKKDVQKRNGAVAAGISGLALLLLLL